MCCQAINEYANPLVTDHDPSSGKWVISLGSLWTKRAISASLFLISITALVCTLLLAMNSKEILIASSVVAGASFVLGCMYTSLLAYVRVKRFLDNSFYDKAELIAQSAVTNSIHNEMYQEAQNRITAKKTTAEGQEHHSDSDD